MQERESHPTGPKLHPENAQKRGLLEVMERHPDIAEALLDPGLPSFVLTKDIENADKMYKDDSVYAVELSQKYLTARFLALLKKGLPNTHIDNENFIEELVRQKVYTDWCAIKLANYEHTPEGEEVKRLYDASPDKDAQSGQWEDVGPSGEKYFSASEKYQLYEKMCTELQVARTELQGMTEELRKYVEKHRSRT